MVVMVLNRVRVRIMMTMMRMMRMKRNNKRNAMMKMVKWKCSNHTTKRKDTISIRMRMIRHI